MIVVLGSSGQLGAAFARMNDVVGLDRARFDLSRFEGGDFSEMLAELRPTGVVNCAAYTAVDRAEAEEELATLVNGHAVGEMSERCAQASVPFVTYSTDYVFDGSARTPYLESQPTDPINAYGRSKLVGELAALASHSGALVIRTSWVVSGTHPNFVRTMIDLVQAGRDLKVVDDQVGCPTVATDLAQATLDAMEHRVSGILHLTNQGPTTWFHLARTAVEMAGLDPDSISPCSTAEYPTPARRPAYSVLGSEVASGMGLTPLPHWEESLPEVVAAQLRR